MSTEYSAPEIFEIAEQLERNGARFYRDLAEKTEGERRTLLIDLAEMEEQHEKTFAALRRRVIDGDGSFYDPDGQAVAYLRAVAGDYLFDRGDSPWEGFEGDESLELILIKAIALEKDAIIFFLGLKEALAGEKERQAIEALLQEEMGHVVVLKAELQKLKEGSP